jgi:murein DD-endopeptidase MepM/ murein hydrolase activator NlpD
MKAAGSVITRLVAALVVLGLAGLAFLLFRDMTPPVVSLTPAAGPVSQATEFSLKIEDQGSGLRHLAIAAVQNGKTTPLASLDLAGERELTKPFTLPEKTLSEGPFTLEIAATDASFSNFFQGRTAEISAQFTLDSRAPILQVESLAHNLNQGGAGLTVFSANEDLGRSGVKVGDLFFAGYRLPDGRYACFFAFPYYLPKDEFKPVLYAQDVAGNIRSRELPYHPTAKNFRQDRITISDSFLNDKMPQFEKDYPGETNLNIFLKVNREMRQRDASELGRLAAASAPEMLWDGRAFLRMKNAAPKAGFGDERDYYYNGEKIDHQTHLGVDLASLQNAPVEASNSGKVVRTGFYGIYGNSIVIDHGLGLQTLYSHLSEIGVEPGQMVQKGEVIGKTGATGMAGGDHLHFGVLVGGLPVSPIEWWDQHWIEDNVTSKLKGTPPETPAPAEPAPAPAAGKKAPAAKKK